MEGHAAPSAPSASRWAGGAARRAPGAETTAPAVTPARAGRTALERIHSHSKPAQLLSAPNRLFSKGRQGRRGARALTARGRSRSRGSQPHSRPPPEGPPVHRTPGQAGGCSGGWRVCSAGELGGWASREGDPGLPPACKCAARLLGPGLQRPLPRAAMVLVCTLLRHAGKLHRRTSAALQERAPTTRRRAAALRRPALPAPGPPLAAPPTLSSSITQHSNSSSHPLCSSSCFTRSPTLTCRIPVPDATSSQVVVLPAGREGG